jgi:hypothetical protein
MSSVRNTAGCEHFSHGSDIGIREELEGSAGVKLILDVARRHRQFIKIREEAGEDVCSGTCCATVYASFRSHTAVILITDLLPRFCQFFLAALTWSCSFTPMDLRSRR